MSAAPDEALRILLVHRPVGPVGGVETHVSLLEELLRARGHEVLRREALPAGRELARLAPHVVHVHHGPLELADGVPGVPVVRTLHDLRPVCPGANRLDRDGGPCARPASLACALHGVAGHCAGLSRWPVPTVSHVARWRRATRRLARARTLLVASRFVEERLVADGFDPRCIELLPYPVHADAAGEPPSACSEVVFAGRLVEPDKGLADLLAIAAGLPADARVVVAGDGPASRAFDARVAREGLGGRVRRVGALAPRDALALIARAALVVLPSRWPEPCGLVGLEAGALGRPVVAYDVGGIGEWLADGVTGHLVPRGDAAAFAARVAALLDDPAGRDRMGAAARARVAARHDPAEHVRALEGHYAAARERAA